MMRVSNMGECMRVTLPPELTAFVQDLVKSGRYPSANEAAAAAVELLQEREELRAFKLERLRQELAKADDDFKAGRYTRYTDETLPQLAEKIKREGRKRLASRKNAG